MGGLDGGSRSRHGLDSVQTVAIPPVIALETRRAVIAIVARAIISIEPAPALVVRSAALSLADRPLALWPIILRALRSAAIIARTLIHGLTNLIAGPLVASRLEPFGAIAAVRAIFARFIVALGTGVLPRTIFVLEIDVEAGDELVAADNLRKRSLRLHGAHHPEVMLGVLKVVFRYHPVAGGMRVAGKLLIFLIDVLGSAANFDAVGTIGIKRAIGVVLRSSPSSATTATSAIAVASALTLHSLEISHAVFKTYCTGLRPDDLMAAAGGFGLFRAQPVMVFD